MGNLDNESSSGNGGADFEAALNVRLAQLLKAEGVDIVRTEKQQPGSAQKRFDIEAKIGTLVIAIEAEIDNRRGALADARKRLREHELGEAVAHEAVAVSYPGGLRVERFDDATVLEWAVLPSEHFAPGRPLDLARVVRLMPEQRGDPEVVAQSLDNALTQACEEITANQMLELAEELDLPVQQTVRGKPKDTTRAAAKRGLLTVMAAAMFHSRLDDHLRTMRPEMDARTNEPYKGPWPPDKLAVCIQSEDPVGALHDAWQIIRALDYKRIFEAACRALMAPSRDEGWTSAVRRVAKAALSAAAAPSSGSHDLIGRIFHRLLDSARYDGSFYTSTSAAVLLAGLAIRPEDLHEDLLDYRVIDPACGTGTLLMAAAERIRDLRPAADREADARTLIEDVIWGLDVNTTACHMAATTLGLMSPSTAFKKMNILKMPLEAGGSEQIEETRVGSLELLETDKRLFVGWSAGHQVDTEVEVEARHNSYDLVIMNPPYTRDSLRHDQFSDTDEKRLKRREKELMVGRAGHGSSSGTMFLDLGEHLVKLDDGSTLAFVFPLTGAGAPSALNVRRLLAEWFHIEWVIASHDLGRFCFSENTDISEMLVVARRHPEAVPSKRPPTKFVCLRQNSALATDALSVVTALQNGTLDEADGSVSEWPSARMAKGQWRPLGLTSPALVESADSISSGKLFEVTTLENVSLIGPAGQRIRDVYTKHKIADEKGRRALWHNDTDKVRSLQSTSDVYIHAKPGEREQRLADKYWSQRSNLFFCDKARLNTVRTIALWTPERAIGSHWIPVRATRGEQTQVWEKAICLYLNSTLGIVGAVAAAAPNLLTRVNFSLDAMGSIPVPELTDQQAQTLASVFDAYAEAELLTLAEIVTDPVRAAADHAVAETLGVSSDAIAQARSGLSREPSVQGR